MSKKTNLVKYTSREFDSIKQDLVNYIKRYYPDTFRDFSEASFGSLMVDTVSYVGDILSFYLDYQANESFLQTAVEYDNIIKLGRQLGYKFQGNSSAYGTASFYISVPSNAGGLGPDANYIPTLKKGSQFTAANGNVYLLNEDVNFANAKNEVRVSRNDVTTGTPTFYAIKAYGEVVSGKIVSETHIVGTYQELLRITLGSLDVAEVLSIVDSEGHEYYETEFLSQNVIYKAVTNITNNSDQASAILKPFVAARRFITSRAARKMTLQFGAASDIILPEDSVADPASVVIQRHGRAYITDTSFDPSKLVANDKLGVAPSNTTLYVTARVNTTRNSNCQVGRLNGVGRTTFEFPDNSAIAGGTAQQVRSSLEVDNEDPISGDVSLPNSQELKTRIYDTFATQNRAVTKTDYESLVYQMPSKFGSIKRVRVVRDDSSFKRNLNLYTISEAYDGSLTATNDIVKGNVKTWLQKSRMLNDTVDILDAKVINLALDFEAVGEIDKNRFDILVAAKARLKAHFSNYPEIGEPFFITDIYAKLKTVDGLLDVTSVKVYQKTGANYSDIRFDLQPATSPDGRYISMPKNVIYEIKFLDADINGVIK